MSGGLRGYDLWKTTPPREVDLDLTYAYLRADAHSLIRELQSLHGEFTHHSGGCECEELDRAIRALTEGFGDPFLRKESVA